MQPNPMPPPATNSAPQATNPIEQIFHYLRRAGVPLGIDDYLLVVQLLRGGRGVESRDDLLFTLKLCWAKSPADLRHVDDAFGLFAPPTLEPGRQRFEDEQPPTPGGAHTGQDAPPANDGQAGGLPGAIKPPPEALPLPAELALLPFDFGPRRLTDELKAAGAYQLEPRLPISERELANIWRGLRLMQRSGPLEELDVETSIATLCRDGFLLAPALRPRRRNQASLLILADQSANMQPYQLIVDALLTSIRRAGLHNRAHLFYFDAYPDALTYYDPHLNRALPLQECLKAYAAGNGVLVVSDGGAARQAYDAGRIQAVVSFVEKVAPYSYLRAWINPAPQWRWPASEAAQIARHVPMFPLTREGVLDAVRTLRGLPVPAR